MQEEVYQYHFATLQNIEELNDCILDVIENNDVLLTLGAGSIGAIAEKLPEAIAK